MRFRSRTSVRSPASRATAQLTVEGGVVSIDGHDVTRAIRTPEMDKAASQVARLPAVRQLLVERQRKVGEQGGVVMEGRDIGTVVFPDADVKVYLDATPEERARRRAADPAHSGGQAGQTAVAASIEARDRSDTHPRGVAVDRGGRRGRHRHDRHARADRRRTRDVARPREACIPVAGV